MNLSAYFNASKISWPGLNNSMEPYVGKLLWQEAMKYQQLNNLILATNKADMENNITAAYQLYRQVEVKAVGMYMMVCLIQINQYWALKPYIHGYMGMISWEVNPTVGEGVTQHTGGGSRPPLAPARSFHLLSTTHS
ncbi:MAG: hypothetical protein ACP5HK_06560 [Acidilobus sp.]